MIEFLIEFLKSNHLASGGLLVMVFGTITGIFYKIIPKILYFIKRKLIVTLEINSQDETFFWFNKWLASLEYTKKTRLLTVYSKISYDDEIAEKDTIKPKLFFVPAPGNHVFFYKGRLVWIQRSKEKLNSGGSFVLYEQFTIIMLGRNKEMLKEMIGIARDYSYTLEHDKVKIYMNTPHGNWQKVNTQKPRSIKTVILKNNLQYEILDDINKFFSKESWYNNLGIPYRRGYLLHGCPGTGKTSIIKSLAGELKSSIYILNITKNLTEGDFNRLIIDIPPKSILLIEDIDRLFKSKGKLDTSYSITFKTILNAIDGIISPYGSIIFMTANNKMKLDNALVRLGRIDKQYFIDKADTKQIEQLFKLFYPNSNGIAKKFSKILKTNTYTPAELQNYFILNDKDTDALKNIKKLEKR